MSDSDNDNQPISAEEEMKLSTALIAHMLEVERLEQEQQYYGNYNGSNTYRDGYIGVNSDRDDSYEEFSEDDYDPNQKKKSMKKKAKKTDENKKGAKRGRKRKIPEENNDNSGDDQPSTSTPKADKIKKQSSKSEKKVENKSATTGENTPSSSSSSSAAATVAENTSKVEKSKKPKKPLPPGMNGGIYTDDEEKLFLEGLDLYGRDWQSLAKHMGTRESHSVRSHAQKHFIKLYRDNLPLPDKVKESGEGFTLSGKPLDPNSAAAKPYLNRAGLTTATESITTKVEKIKITSSETNQSSSTPTTPASSKSENKKPKSKKPKVSDKQKTQNDNTDKKPLESTSAYDENGRTSYSHNRLRNPPPKPNDYVVRGLNSDPLTLVKCEEFDCESDRNSTHCQPFSLKIHTNVTLVMDFHAHLKTTEIIGLLAGTWDWRNRRIVIKEAYPCRSLNTGHNEVNVEMDPASALEVRQIIEQKDMLVVGWYHSHPTFLPDPSYIDIDNQFNYQKLSKDDYTFNPATEAEAETETISNDTMAITSSDNKNNNNNNNTSNSFEDDPDNTIALAPFVGAIVTPYDPDLKTSASAINWFYVDITASGKVPKRLSYEIIESSNLPADDENRMLTLLDDYRISSEKTNFKEIWKISSTENKLTKLIKSIATRMPWVEKQIVNRIKKNNTVNNNNGINTSHSTDTNNDNATKPNKGKGKEVAMNIDTQNSQNMDIDEDEDEDDNNGALDRFLQTVKVLLENW